MKKQCTKCGRMLDYSEFYRYEKSRDGLSSRCKECVSKYQKEKNVLLKREAMNAFGGRCNYINENGTQCSKNAIDNIEDLDLIHPNGDGNEHRALISNRQGSSPFYRALKKGGWKTGKFVVKVMCRSHHLMFDRSGKKHPLYGTSRSKETKTKIGIANIGKKNPNYGKYGNLNPAYKKGKFNNPIWLKKKYETMTQQEIADLCRVSLGLIRRRFKEFNIERRKRGQRP